ncbi:MAG: hypothetical protein HYY55_03035 [Candidatus Niyogibacteria bacterium]|nr:MAG: hypothetical protein HYY55_03035 [Candidatus Niyogibacteria bacterium]
MNKPLAIGLIIFFILVIAAGAIWLAVRPAPLAEEAERGFLQRFPFGLFGGGEPAQPSPETAPAPIAEELALLMLDQGPVESFSIKETGLRYLLKQDGHIMDIGPRGEDQTRVSNTTIPKIFETSWSQNASKIIFKYIENDNIRTVSAEFIATSTRATVLPQNIISFAFAPDRERLLYLVPTPNGSRLIAADPDNSRQTDVASFPFGDFDIYWPEKNSVYLLSRPSGVAEGFLFKYDLQRGTLNKILGDLAGLQIKFSDDGQKVIYSVYDAASEKPRLFIYDLNKKTAVDIQTDGLAEKCSFTRKNAGLVYCGLDQGLQAAVYPDEWLQGSISTSDTLWEINFETGQKRLLDETLPFNIKQITVSYDGVFLFFIDKNSGSLWSLEIIN